MSFRNSIYRKNAINEKNKTPAEKWVEEITVGWNLGNTLDSEDGLFHPTIWGTENEAVFFETCWGTPLTTEAMIEEIKNKGFNAIRVPVTWSSHLSNDASLTISPIWMNRVKQVVEWITSRGMKCIINTHHDDGRYWTSASSYLGRSMWLYCDPDTLNVVLPRVDRVWSQIAEAFKSYSNDLLVFEAYNELMTSARSWMPPTQAEYEGLNQIAQTFVNSVRATGGNNLKRILCCTTYMSGTYNWQYFRIPSDPSGFGYIFTQFHPYNSFTNQDVETEILKEIDDIHKSLNVPVIFGECGTWVSTPHYKRVQNALNFSSRSRAHGYRVFWWDDNGELGLFDRNNLTWRFPEITDAFVRGFNHYPRYVEYMQAVSYTDSSEYTYGYLNTLGSDIIQGRGGLVTPLISIDENEAYQIRTISTDGGDRTELVWWFDENQQPISVNQYGQTNLVSVIPPVGARFLKTYIYNPWNLTWTESYLKSRVDAGNLGLIITPVKEEFSHPSLNISSFDFNLFGNWNSGDYDALNDSRENSLGKMSTDKMICESLHSYLISISDSNFAISICEYDTQLKPITVKSNFIDGMYFISSEKTSYIAVTLYNINNEDFTDYQGLFNTISISITELDNPNLVNGAIPITENLFDKKWISQGRYNTSKSYLTYWNKQNAMRVNYMVKCNPSTTYEIFCPTNIIFKLLGYDANKNFVSDVGTYRNGAIVDIGQSIEYLLVYFYYKNNNNAEDTAKTQEDFILDILENNFSITFSESQKKVMSLTQNSQGTRGYTIGAEGNVYNINNNQYYLWEFIDVSPLTNKDIYISASAGVIFCEYDENYVPILPIRWDGGNYTLNENTKYIRISKTWVDASVTVKFIYTNNTYLTYGAQEEIPVLTDEIYDTFTRTDSSNLGATEAGNKTWISSSFSIVNGKIENTGTGNCYAVVETENPNIEISADLIYKGYVALIGRCSPTNIALTHIRARISSAGISLFRFENGGTYEYGSYSFSPVNGQSYSVKMTFNGNTIRVYLNDILRITADSPSFVENTLFGVFGGQYLGNKADNIKINTSI